MGIVKKNKMNPVVHFEMPANDRKRMADFYTKVFGWCARNRCIFCHQSTKARKPTKRYCLIIFFGEIWCPGDLVAVLF
jgi:predicted enzyme related to lactoylglutathione lyase